jgi:subtilisin family serine protease
MKKLLSIKVVSFFLLFRSIYSQVPGKYWIQFIDKQYSSYNINEPEKFLSEKAINKRKKYNISIDESDLPVSQYYIDSIQKLGFTLLTTSKWFNAATVYTPDTSNIRLLRNITFINKIEKTANLAPLKSSRSNKFNIKTDTNVSSLTNDTYGQSYEQIHQLNGDFLHQMGYRGKGMDIAIIDAGFYDANQLPAFDSLFQDNRINGTKDFVNPGGNVYQEYEHGMWVLSLIGGNIPGTILGTAPDASFWLLRSEDAATENPIEEDNWVSAAEFADSAGVDVINTSLGYSIFDDSSFNLSYKDMNGKTTRIAIAANIAASKGMLVVVSAGNSGDDPWHYITTPADAFNILAVGAVDYTGTKAWFSSFGPSYDGRIKPNIVAMGVNDYIQNTDGTFGTGSGTSFSAPLITGLAACLWQAFPNASNAELIRTIELSANHYLSPDNSTGYGIPDFERAYNLFKNSFSTINVNNRLFPNPFNNFICVDLRDFSNDAINIEIYNSIGAKINQFTVNNEYPVVITNGIEALQTGMYIIKCSDNKTTESFKIIKY